MNEPKKEEVNNNNKNQSQSMLKAIEKVNASTRRVNGILSNVDNQIKLHRHHLSSSTSGTTQNANSNHDPNNTKQLTQAQMHQTVNKLKKRILEMSELIMQTKNDIRIEEVNRTRLMKVLYELKLKENEKKTQQQQQHQQHQHSKDRMDKTVQKVKSVTRLSHGTRRQRQSNKHLLSPTYWDLLIVIMIQWLTSLLDWQPIMDRSQNKSLVFRPQINSLVFNLQIEIIVKEYDRSMMQVYSLKIEGENLELFIYGTIFTNKTVILLLITNI